MKDLPSRLIAAVACLAAVLAGSPAPGTVSAGGISSSNVEWVGALPYVIDGVGGRLVGKYFYLTDQNKLMILDVSNPELPLVTGVLPLPQEWLFSREDLDTNGEILLYPSDIANALLVIDVHDKNLPRILSTVYGAGDHTMSCVLNCTWGYGSYGTIVDLRNPESPVLRQERWTAGTPAPKRGGHDVEEVAPGLVLTATQPIVLLDASADPTHPKVLASGGNDDRRYIHSVRWPRRAQDKFIIASDETNFTFSCGGGTGSFMTWDATKWQNGSLAMIDQFRVRNGTYVDGNAAVDPTGCSAHWFDAHPAFADGGLVAAAWYEHGTRFLQVNPAGKISEVGWFLPFGGSTGAAYWITNEIVYVTDYNRGLDILRFKSS